MSSLTYKLKNKYAALKYKKYIDAILLFLLISYLIFSFTKSELMDDAAKKLGVETGEVYTADYPVNFHAIDVGTADCLLLTCNGHNVLIDGGKYEDLDKVLNYLSCYGIHDFDALICSHPDSDHTGVFEEIVKRFPVKVFYQSPIMDNTKRQDITALKNLLKEKSIPVHSLQAGDEFSIASLNFHVTAPISKYDETNEMSLVIKVTYRDFSLLLCGDMAESEMEDLLESSEDLDVDILKVAHHGSKTGTSPEFITRCSPKYAVISVGRGNRYLPNEKTVSDLTDYGCHVMQTENDGNIIISTACDGRYTIKTKRG